MASVKLLTTQFRKLVVQIAQQAPIITIDGIIVDTKPLGIVYQKWINLRSKSYVEHDAIDCRALRISNGSAIVDGMTNPVPQRDKGKS